MSRPPEKTEQPVAGWRLKLGVALFVLSIILPLVGVPVVSALDLSSTVIATVSGGLLMAAELIGITAVAVMGKPGYVYIKSRVSDFFRQYGPPQQVSRRRYNTGLVLFFIPVLFAWISVYAADYIPGFVDNPLPYAITGDLLLLTSLFVLGETSGTNSKDYLFTVTGFAHQTWLRRKSRPGGSISNRHVVKLLLRLDFTAFGLRINSV